MPPPVVSLSQINKKKRSFVPKVAARAPSVTPNRPPSSRQSTLVPSDVPPDLFQHASTSSERPPAHKGNDSFVAPGSPDLTRDHASVLHSPTASVRQPPVVEGSGPRSVTRSISPVVSTIRPRPALSQPPVSVELSSRPVSIRPPSSTPQPAATSIGIPLRPPSSSSRTIVAPTTTSPDQARASLTDRHAPLPAIPDSIAPPPPPSSLTRKFIEIDPSLLPSTSSSIPPVTAGTEDQPQASKSSEPGASAEHYTPGLDKPLFLDDDVVSDVPALAANAESSQEHPLKAVKKAGPRARARRAAAKVIPNSDTEGVDAQPNVASTSDPKPAPKRPRRPRKTKPAEPTDDVDDIAEDHSQTPKPKAKRKRGRRPSSARQDSGEPGAETDATQDVTTDGDDAPTRAPKKQRKNRAKSTASTTTGKSGSEKPARKPRKKRKTTEQVAEEDAEAENKEHDPTLTTMSALVEDLPVGRSTSTRTEIQERIRANRNRDRARREQLRVADRNVTLGKPRNEALERGYRETPPPATATEANAGGNEDDEDDDGIFKDERDRLFDEDAEDDGEDDWIGGIASSSFVPQISMDDDGRIAADELHMEIERPDTFREENYERVFERDADRFVNSLSHSKRHKGSARWSNAETATFFHNLAMYGTDFESIARVMPGRTRHEVKNKFNAEDRRNAQLINEYLFKPKPIDLEEAGRMTGKDLSGPPPEIRGLSVLNRMGSEPAAATGKESEPDFTFDEESGSISAVVKEAVVSDAEGVANDDEDEENANEDSSTNAQAESSTSRSPSPIAPQDLFANITRSSSLTT